MNTSSHSLLHRCHVDGLSCEVADLIAPSLHGRGGSQESGATSRLIIAFGQVVDCLPCSMCREARVAVARLPGTRLGKHERNLLLYAPSPTAQSGAILDPDLVTHSDRETCLRAIRKLSKLGLLDARQRLVRVVTGGKRKDGTVVSRSYAHRTIRQTLLGAVVVEYYRSEMEKERAIRWDRNIQAIRARLVLSMRELLVAFEKSLDVRLDSLGMEVQADASKEKDAQEARNVIQPLRDALREAVERSTP